MSVTNLCTSNTCSWGFCSHSFQKYSLSSYCLPGKCHAREKPAQSRHTRPLPPPRASRVGCREMRTAAHTPDCWGRDLWLGACGWNLLTSRSDAFHEGKREVLELGPLRSCHHNSGTKALCAAQGHQYRTTGRYFKRKNKTGKEA